MGGRSARMLPPTLMLDYIVLLLYNANLQYKAIALHLLGWSVDPPFSIDWKLRDLLEQEDVTVYALAKKLEESMEEPIHITTLYRWTSATPGTPNFEGIGWVLWGLGQLTGKTYQIGDVLEYSLREP